MSELKKIKLSGSLGKRFGVFHSFAVDSFGETIRALCSQVDGFKEFITSEVGVTMKFAIFIDGKSAGHNDLDKWSVGREVRIIPVPAGSKNGGLGQIIIGAAMVVAAFYTAGWSLAAMGAMGTSAALMGTSMILGGISQMLAPQPGGMRKEANNKPSYAFGGAVNTVAAGYPVPIPYGHRTVGGCLLSSGSYSEDIQ